MEIHYDEEFAVGDDGELFCPHCAALFPFTVKDICDVVKDKTLYVACDVCGRPIQFRYDAKEEDDEYVDAIDEVVREEYIYMRELTKEESIGFTFIPAKNVVRKEE